MVITKNGQEIAIAMDAALICNDPDVLLDATRQGLGIGRIFTHNMQQQTDSADFIPILQKYWRKFPPIYLYYPQHSQRVKKYRL